MKKTEEKDQEMGHDVQCEIENAWIISVYCNEVEEIPKCQ